MGNSSVFDPETFLNMEVVGSNSTSRPPIPEMEATLVGKDIKLRTPKDSVILDIFWVVDEEEAREATGMKEPQVRQSIFLDIDASGHLDMGTGKNVGLGKLREALGQNDEDNTWSPNMIIGAVARGKIGQRPDDKDPSIIYNDVVALVAMD